MKSKLSKILLSWRGPDHKRRVGSFYRLWDWLFANVWTCHTHMISEHPLVGCPFPLEQKLIIDINIYVYIYVRNQHVMNEEGQDGRVPWPLPVLAWTCSRQRKKNGYRETVLFKGKMKKPGNAWLATSSLFQLFVQSLISYMWVIVVGQT